VIPGISPHALPYVALPNAFTPGELDDIERIGDRLAVGKATITGIPQTNQYDAVRITETAWLDLADETGWLYAKMGDIVRAFNERFFHFELTGFSQPFQYTVYRAPDGSHYDWHADHGDETTSPRKLSLSVQLTDPARYEGCGLQTHVGKDIAPAPRERGTVIAFPSYVLHRVTPITAGVRKALVAWATGPMFR
jgi:PKHD-type hydroxylase